MTKEKFEKSHFLKRVNAVAICVLLSALLINCSAQNPLVFKPTLVYQSGNLIITQVSENAFQHTSFKQTNDFGNVPCNGLIVKDNDEAIVFDTPTNDISSDELISWVKKTLHCKINAVIPTHFHDDCLGGLSSFEKNNIPSYAYFKTIELAKEQDYVLPKNSFSDSVVLKVGSKKIIAKFYGEGHTKDNIICYFPSENVMFGGCLIKEMNAGKGYLGDANITAWSATVKKIRHEYPNVKIIVPGHGGVGNKQLLDYTISLFTTK